MHFMSLQSWSPSLLYNCSPFHVSFKFYQSDISSSFLRNRFPLHVNVKNSEWIFLLLLMYGFPYQYFSIMEQYKVQISVPVLGLISVVNSALRVTFRDGLALVTICGEDGEGPNCFILLRKVFNTSHFKDS